MEPAIAFVHLGGALPPWLDSAVRQARLFNDCAIYVIAAARDLEATDLVRRFGVVPVATEDLVTTSACAAFRRLSGLDRSFRSGFWTYTTERFFVLEAMMLDRGLSNVVHLENDVMLYADLCDLAPRLERVYPGLAVAFDNDARGVPGFVYIPTPAALSCFTAFVVRLFERLCAAGSVASWRSVNDMMLFGRFRGLGNGAVDHLPIVPPKYATSAPLRSAVGHVPSEPSRYWRNAEEIGFIFDAAAIGQYLGGVDPRNAAGPTQGFVNESCVFDPRLLRHEMRVDAVGRRTPWIVSSGSEYPVANVHVHSKDLARFASS